MRNREDFQRRGRFVRVVGAPLISYLPAWRRRQIKTALSEAGGMRCHKVTGMLPYLGYAGTSSAAIYRVVVPHLRPGNSIHVTVKVTTALMPSWVVPHLQHSRPTKENWNSLPELCQAMLRVSGFSHFHPCNPVLLHTHLTLIDSQDPRAHTHLIPPALQGNEDIVGAALLEEGLDAGSALRVVTEGRVQLDSVRMHVEDVRVAQQLPHDVWPHQSHLVSLYDERPAVPLMQPWDNTYPSSITTFSDLGRKGGRTRRKEERIQAKPRVHHHTEVDGADKLNVMVLKSQGKMKVLAKYFSSTEIGDNFSATYESKLVLKVPSAVRSPYCMARDMDWRNGYIMRQTGWLVVHSALPAVQGKGSDLMKLQKGIIISFWPNGGSISETAMFVNCSRASVVKVYHVWMNGTIGNTPH
ncbi:hypothetical protein PR048_033014 [Dryococelus australis]|uniref:Uncharacterized protein n=1 Tax=Dryococelus australis TaxID=614101 RepID=A0ABQ9G3W3_9NEOP|nr:hypothetical protein PR048_033014 [Dryococelus australis]